MNPNNIENWNAETWLYALGFSIAGGVASFYAKVKLGKEKDLNWKDFAGETFTSGFVGLMAFILQKQYDQPLGVCVIAAGVGGHMAVHLICLVENKISKYLDNTTTTITGTSTSTVTGAGTSTIKSNTP